MKWIGRIIVALAAIYAALVGVIAANQSKLLYFPVRKVSAPADWSLPDVEVVTLDTDDNIALKAWWLAPSPGAPVIVIFGGNGSAPTGFVAEMRTFAARGWGVLVPAYRGYFGSAGSPSKSALLADADRWTQWAMAEAPDAPVVIWGQSLGSGIAAEAAVRNGARALILEAPYTTMAEVAAFHYPLLPAALVLRDRYDTRTPLGQFRGDVLIEHGLADGTVPPHMGQELYERCKARVSAGRCVARFPPRGQHNDLRAFGLIESATLFIAGETGDK